MMRSTKAVRPAAMRLLLAAPLLALAGCVSLGAEPPESLLTLTSEASAPAGTAVTATAAQTLAIHEPEVPAEIDVARVPVRTSNAELAYLENAFWVEKPARLFRRLLAETVRAETGQLVIDGDNPGLFADEHLRGMLRDMSYDARSSSVSLRFDAIRSLGGDAVETRRFEASEDLVPADAAAVGAAFNRVSNDVARQVAAWLSGAPMDAPPAPRGVGEDLDGMAGVAEEAV